MTTTRLRVIIAAAVLITTLLLAVFHVNGWTQSIGTLAAGYIMGTISTTPSGGAGTAKP